MQYLCTHFPPLLSCGQSSSQLVSIRIPLQLLARDQKYTYSERVDLTKNERTQEVCKYRLWYLKLVAGPFTIAVVLVGTMYPSTLERDPVLCCCSCTAVQNNITSINGHHSIYWYSIANVFRAFRPSSDKHFTCLCACLPRLLWSGEIRINLIHLTRRERTRYVQRVCPEGIHTIFRNETRSPVFDVLPSIHSFILDPHLPL